MYQEPFVDRVAPEKVTVIVPTFNRAHFIDETLESLIGQTQQPGRIIVIDDGSTDNTVDVVGRYGPLVEYYRQENSGKAAALNRILEMVPAGLVWIFDDDDLALPTALEKMLRVLRDNPNCGFVYGQHQQLTVMPDGERVISDIDIPVVKQEVFFLRNMERCITFQCEMLVRRACYEEVGAFDTSLIRSQDYDMLLRLLDGVIRNLSKKRLS